MPIDFSDLTDSIIDEFPVTVTYSPKNGDASTFSVIIGYEPAEEERGDDGISLVRRASMVVRSTDVAAPNRLDTVTIDDGEWAVMSIEPQALGAAFDLGIIWTSSIEKSGPSYRKGRE